MPGENDAISQLLATKYGILPDQIPEMRKAILREEATGSEGLKGEALELTTKDQLTRMKELEYLAYLATHKDELLKEPRFKKDYEKFIGDSQASVRSQAQKLTEDKVAQQVEPEVNRLHNMGEWGADLKQKGHGYSTGYLPPGDFSGLVPMPNRVDVIPVRPPVRVEAEYSSQFPEPTAPAGPVTPPNAIMEGGKIAPEDVYRARLQRALAMRQAALGK